MAKSPLKHLNDFKSVLNNYEPSQELVSLLDNNKFVLLSAPSAAGRNTIINQLIMTGKYYYVVSDTTRRPRTNNGLLEQNGKEYWFKTEEEFLYSLKNGYYIEAAIIHNQQVSGVSMDEIKHASENHKVAITDIDIHGCDTIYSYSDNVQPVFILPPDFEEWMSRLDGRGSMEPEEKKRRLISAYDEIKLALGRAYFKFITNYDLKYTVEQLHEHIMNDNFEPIEQKQAVEHAKQLLIDLKAYNQ